MRTDLIEHTIKNTRLPIVPRYRRGYLVPEVDALLDNIVRRHLPGAPSTPRSLMRSCFTSDSVDTTSGRST